MSNFRFGGAFPAPWTRLPADNIRVIRELCRVAACARAYGYILFDYYFVGNYVNMSARVRRMT